MSPHDRVEARQRLIDTFFEIRRLLSLVFPASGPMLREGHIRIVVDHDTLRDMIRSEYSLSALSHCRDERTGESYQTWLGCRLVAVAALESAEDVVGPLPDGETIGEQLVRRMPRLIAVAVDSGSICHTLWSPHTDKFWRTQLIDTSGLPEDTR